ncbi:hypothetical protein ACFYY8_33410 [Streptosporangium sp. NPDC001559]|uniref:hypothetical protein n=1 Tax=Streptosporangium sp. NPDC001559 TaxID=3366187 RepID=UPI0036EC20A6
MHERTALKPQTQCQPWCTDHHSGGPDDAQCRNRVITSHGQTVMVQDAEDTRIWVFTNEPDLTIAAAEQLAYSLLAQVAAARTAVAA